MNFFDEYFDLFHYLNVEFSYKQEGLVFYHDGLSINFIFLIIFSPIIIYTYVGQVITLKNTFSNYYKVDIYTDKGILKLNGFLDTGNKLVDPYNGKPIIIINSILWKEPIDKFLLVPVNTISESSMLKVIKVKKIDIKGIGIKQNVLVGLADKKIKMEGIDCILNSKLLEG